MERHSVCKLPIQPEVVASGLSVLEGRISTSDGNSNSIGAIRLTRTVTRCTRLGKRVHLGTGKRSWRENGKKTGLVQMCLWAASDRARLGSEC